MFFDPPLVEIPTATSSGRACAIIWRRKMTSVPTSFANAVMLAGSSDNEMAGMRTVAVRAAACNRLQSRWRR